MLDGARAESRRAAGRRTATRYAEYHARMLKFARVLAQAAQPPSAAHSAAAADRTSMTAAMLGLDIRRLGRESMREFLRIAGINIYDVLEETFESPLLKGALALRRGARHEPRAALEQLGARAAAPA